MKKFISILIILTLSINIYAQKVLNGNSDPANSLGQNGDFYINIMNWQIFGPKTAGAWIKKTNLIGQSGNIINTNSLVFKNNNNEILINTNKIYIFDKNLYCNKEKIFNIGTPISTTQFYIRAGTIISNNNKSLISLNHSIMHTLMTPVGQDFAYDTDKSFSMYQNDANVIINNNIKSKMIGKQKFDDTYPVVISAGGGGTFFNYFLPEAKASSYGWFTESIFIDKSDFLFVTNYYFYTETDEPVIETSINEYYRSDRKRAWINVRMQEFDN